MYPAVVDLDKITINGINGIAILGVEVNTNYGLAIATGNVFNGSIPSILIGDPYSSGFLGKGYVMGGTLKTALPSNGIITISQANTYFTYFFTINSSNNQDEICASITVADVDGDGVDDIFCGSYGGGTSPGSAYWIRGGSWLRSISSLNVNTLNGVNGCRFMNFFNVGDNCGYSTAIARNFTGDGRNAFAIGCQSAFSNSGAVVIIPYSTNFCSTGSITGSNFDGVKATYYRGTALSKFGYSLSTIFLKNNYSESLVIGSQVAGTYLKFPGADVMTSPPLSSTNLDKIFQGIPGDSSGITLNNIGDIYNEGCDSLKIGANTASYGSQGNAGRDDIIRCNFNFTNKNSVLPNDLNGQDGFTVYDIVSGERLGSGGGNVGDPNGDGFQDFAMSAQNALRFGRANAGAVALCFGGNPIWQGNNTLIYQNLIDGKICSEFYGRAGEHAGFPTIRNFNFWDNDTLSDWALGSYTFNNGGGQVGIVRIIFGDKEPQWQSYPFINIAKCSQMTLQYNNSIASFNALDQTDVQGDFIYDVNINNGNVTLINNNNLIITNFTHSQLINNQVRVSRNCNNLLFTMDMGIRVIKQGVQKLAFLPPQPVVVNFSPNISFPLLHQSGSVRLTTSNLDALCDYGCGMTPDLFKFTVSGTSAFIARYPAISTPYPTFSKADLLATEPNGIYLTSDGSNKPPVLDVLLKDNTTQLNITASAQLVPFSDMPTLKNNLLLSVFNRTVPVHANQLLATQKYNLTSIDQLLLTTNCTDGNFYSFYKQAPISTFANSNLTSDHIGIITGTNGVAKCNITIRDGYKLSPPISLNFSYYSGPKFGALSLGIGQGNVNKRIDLNELNLQNIMWDLNQYTFETYNSQHISYNCKNASGDPAVPCTLPNIQLSGLGGLFATHDDSLNTPTTTFKITDTYYDLSDETVPFYSLAYKPTGIFNSILEINQTSTISNPRYFGTEIFSCSSASSPLSSLMVQFTNQPQCSIDSNQNPGNSLVSYNDLTNRNTRVVVTDGTSNAECRFNATCIDPNHGYLVSDPVKIDTTFNDIPRKLTATLTVVQDTLYKLRLSDIDATNNANNKQDIFVKTVSLLNAMLSSNATGTLTPILNGMYRLSDEADGLIFFKQNNGAEPPIWIFQFVSQKGLASQFYTISESAGNLNFDILHPAPQLTFNPFLAIRGTPNVLTPQIIGVQIGDPTVQLSRIRISITLVSNAWVQRIKANPDDPLTVLPLNIQNAITDYEYSESLTKNNIQFIPNGSKNDPVICVKAETPLPNVIANLGGPICKTITLFVPQIKPSIKKKTIKKIARNEELVLTEENLFGVSGFTQDTNPGNLDWEMTCQNAVLKTNSTGTIVDVPEDKFKQQNTSNHNIRMKASNTNNKVTCTVKLTNSDGNSDEGQMVIGFEEWYGAPAINVNNIPLQIGSNDCAPILTSALASSDDPGNEGGRFGITESARLSFNITNIYGCSLRSGFTPDVHSFSGAFIGNSLEICGIESNCKFNFTVCNLANSCTQPIAANINWLPSKNLPITSDVTSFSLIGGANSAAGIGSAFAVAFSLLFVKYCAPRIIDKCCFEGNVVDPLELAILKNMNKRLTLVTPASCFLMSADKTDQYSGAVQKIIAQMRIQGIQTRSDWKLENKNPCDCFDCCKARKEKMEIRSRRSAIEKDELPLLDDIAVSVIARTVVDKIKIVCVSKRGKCKRCVDRYCLCRRDVEDEDILKVEQISSVKNTVKIAELVRKELLDDKSKFVLKTLPKWDEEGEFFDHKLDVSHNITSVSDSKLNVGILTLPSGTSNESSPTASAGSATSPSSAAPLLLSSAALRTASSSAVNRDANLTKSDVERAAINPTANASTSANASVIDLDFMKSGQLSAASPNAAKTKRSSGGSGTRYGNNLAVPLVTGNMELTTLVSDNSRSASNTPPIPGSGPPTPSSPTADSPPTPPPPPTPPSQKRAVHS